MPDLLTPAEVAALQKLVADIATSTDPVWGRRIAREYLGMPPSPGRDTLFCSFCGRTEHEVAKLIIEHRVGICDDCVQCCVDILAETNDAALDEIRRLGT